MTERLEIDALRALSAIAECGGVTRAAAYLSLSQSAVSHKIKRLETSIGSVLLTRRPGAPLLTDAGERLLVYAKRILDLHDEALMALGIHALSGEIRLGMTEDTTTSGLSRILGRFTRLYPEVSVRTRVSQSLILVSELNDGLIDVAVMQIFKSNVQPTDILLYEDHLHWIKSFDYEFDISKPIPFLSFDENCFFRHWALEYGRSQDHIIDTVLECSSTAGIASAVVSGLGVSLLNGRHITPEMQVIDHVLTPPPDVAYVIRSNRKSRSKAVEILTQEIVREVGNIGALRVA